MSDHQELSQIPHDLLIEEQSVSSSSHPLPKYQSENFDFQTFQLKSSASKDKQGNLSHPMSSQSQRHSPTPLSVQNINNIKSQQITIENHSDKVPPKQQNSEAKNINIDPKKSFNRDKFPIQMRHMSPLMEGHNLSIHERNTSVNDNFDEALPTKDSVDFNRNSVTEKTNKPQAKQTKVNSKYPDVKTTPRDNKTEIVEKTFSRLGNSFLPNTTPKYNIHKDQKGKLKDKNESSSCSSIKDEADQNKAAFEIQTPSEVLRARIHEKKSSISPISPKIDIPLLPLQNDNNCESNERNKMSRFDSIPSNPGFIDRSKTKDSLYQSINYAPSPLRNKIGMNKFQSHFTTMENQARPYRSVGKWLTSSNSQENILEIKPQQYHAFNWRNDKRKKNIFQSRKMTYHDRARNEEEESSSLFQNINTTNLLLQSLQSFENRNFNMISHVTQNLCKFNNDISGIHKKANSRNFIRFNTEFYPERTGSFAAQENQNIENTPSKSISKLSQEKFQSLSPPYSQTNLTSKINENKGLTTEKINECEESYYSLKAKSKIKNNSSPNHDQEAQKQTRYQLQGSQASPDEVKHEKVVHIEDSKMEKDKKMNKYGFAVSAIFSPSNKCSPILEENQKADTNIKKQALFNKNICYMHETQPAIKSNIRSVLPIDQIPIKFHQQTKCKTKKYSEKLKKQFRIESEGKDVLMKLYLKCNQNLYKIFDFLPLNDILTIASLNRTYYFLAPLYPKLELRIYAQFGSSQGFGYFRNRNLNLIDNYLKDATGIYHNYKKEFAIRQMNYVSKWLTLSILLLGIVLPFMLIFSDDISQKILWLPMLVMWISLLFLIIFIPIQARRKHYNILQTIEDIFPTMKKIKGKAEKHPMFNPPLRLVRKTLVFSLLLLFLSFSGLFLKIYLFESLNYTISLQLGGIFTSALWQILLVHQIYTSKKSNDCLLRSLTQKDLLDENITPSSMLYTNAIISIQNRDIWLINSMIWPTIIFHLFTILLGLRLDDSLNISWHVLLIPFWIIYLPLLVLQIFYALIYDKVQKCKKMLRILIAMGPVMIIPFIIMLGIYLDESVDMGTSIMFLPLFVSVGIFFLYKLVLTKL